MKSQALFAENSTLMAGEQKSFAKTAADILAMFSSVKG